MKNKKIMEAILYVVLFVTWVLSGLDMIVKTETVIQIAIFISCCAVYFFVKKAAIKYSAIAVLTIGISIYNYEYILLYVPVLVLIVMLKNMYSQEDNKITETCNTFYITLTVFRLVYMLVLFLKEDAFVAGRLGFYFKVSAIMLFVLVFLLLMSYQKEKKADKNILNKLRTMYIFSIIGIVIDICIYAIKNVHGEIQAAQIEFSVWLVLILCILYFRDPVTEKCISYLNNKELKFLGSKR